MERKNSIRGLIFRYLLLVLVAMIGFKIFYFIFLPLTIYPLYFLFKIFLEINLVGNVFFIGNLSIGIIGACVAGSAYSLLFILNLSIPNVKISKRLKMIGFSFGIFFLINILRIFVLSLMYVTDSSWFEIAHKLFWYLGSTLFVILIWFWEVYLFKIKSVPIYTDLKHLYLKSYFGKRKK